MSVDWLTVRLRLEGARQFQTQTAESAGAVKVFGNEAAVAGKKTAFAAEKAFLFGESMYSLRRYGFYAITSLGLTGAAVLKLGFDFDRAKQEGVDALAQITGGVVGARREVEKLIGITHSSGIGLGTLVEDTKIMHTFGYSIRDTNAYLATFANYAGKKGLGAGGVDSLVAVFDRIKSQGYLSRREQSRLSALGVPPSALENALHMTRDQRFQFNTGQLWIPSSQAVPALAGWMRSWSKRQPYGMGQLFSILKGDIAQQLGGAEGGFFGAVRGRLTSAVTGFQKGGTSGMLRGLDPTAILLHGWVAFTNLLKIAGIVLHDFWSVLRLVLIVASPLLLVLGVLTGHLTLMKIALYPLIAYWTVTRSLMLANAVAMWAWGAAETAYLVTLYALDAAMLVYTTIVRGAATAMVFFNLALYANPIALLVVGLVALGAGFYFLYTRVRAVRDGISWLWSMIRDLASWLKHHALTIVLDIGTGGLFSVVKAGISLAHHIPGLAGGGDITRGGMAMVGERGRELLHLPAGARVTPLTGGMGGDMFVNAIAEALRRIVIVPGDVRIDGQKVAEVVFGVKQTAEARA